MNFIEDFAETIKNIQGFQPDLFAGATETELKAAEEKMNIMLPEDFKKFYRAFNGQNEYADALLCEVNFPLELIVNTSVKKLKTALKKRRETEQ